MSATLERMRWWDVAEVRAIEAALFPGDAWSVEQFWQELAHPTRSYVVARQEREIVGYAGAFVVPPDADVQTIAVRSDQQGRGIASQLLRWLLAEADRRGATHLVLEVRADNAPALALYERFAFTRISQRRGYYPDGSDAVIMRRAVRDRTPA